MDATAVSAVVTAVGVLIAALALVLPMRADRKQRDDELAAHLRQTVKICASAASDLIAPLPDGSTLIGTASNTVDYLRQQLPDPATVSDFWRLVDDPQQILRAAVMGFATSHSESRARSKQVIQSADAELTGALDIVSAAGQLVIRIEADGCGPMLFVNVLTGKPLDFFKKENTKTPLKELWWNLSSFLQSNAAAYFAARYLEVLTELQAFIDKATEALTELNTEQLLTLARARVVTRNSPGSYTGDMRSSIDTLSARKFIGADDTAALTAMLDRLEALLPKEAAMARAAASMANTGSDEPARETPPIIPSQSGPSDSAQV